jgi:hypothetical protein
MKQPSDGIPAKTRASELGETPGRQKSVTKLPR